MSVNWRALVGVLWSTVVLNISAIPLPNNFYGIVNGQPVSTLSVKSTDPIFYIVVPEFSSKPSSSKQKLAELSAFMKNAVVPKDFFIRATPQVDTAPVALFFDWQEQENSKIRKQAGQELALGIKKLRRRFKDSKVILVGHGQGSNVINVASNHVSLPFETVIELSTPVFPHTQDAKKDLYVEYIPNKKMINQMFSFYSDQAFSILHPTLHPEYQAIYQDKVHPNLTNVLLLINNKHPLPGETLRPLVGQKILALCQSIKSTYRLHNHLVAHLSTIKPDTDMVVVLKNSTISKSRNRPTQKVAQERILSEVRMQQFTKSWGRPMALALSDGEKSRNLHKSIELLATQKKG